MSKERELLSDEILPLAGIGQNYGELKQLPADKTFPGLRIPVNRNNPRSMKVFSL
ncbi:MAG: hypothetical protein H7X84_09475 [Verrucomicrobia bacterium]|nr:hypothetical protein [Prolixibacteraceae bacterium]